MSRNRIFLVLTAVVLALTVNGVALAGSAEEERDKALYGQPDPFAAVETSTGDTRWAFTGDQRVRGAPQQASTAPTPWFTREQPAPATRDDLYRPE